MQTLDQIAIEYNKTKDPKLKELWYRKIKEIAYGINYNDGRSLSSSRSNKTDDGKYKII
jgi:hypothetical protein